jgi:K+-sensing histidine kinase KdpD
MQAMVDALLTLTRLQSQDVIEKKEINIFNIAHEAVENLEKKYKNKSMDIHFSVESKDNGDVM